MAYANIISTIAILLSSLSLLWQIYVWVHERDKGNTPCLRVYLQKDSNDTFFVIENIGICCVEITKITINAVDVFECRAITEPQLLITEIRPENQVRSRWAGFQSNWKLYPLGSPVIIEGQVDKRLFKQKYSLVEAS